MKYQTNLSILTAGLLAIGLPVFAQNAPSPAPAPPADSQSAKPSAPAPTPTPAADTQAPKPAPSTTVANLIKMLDAGVSKDVIKSFIETMPADQPLTSADLIALKDKGVSDEITLALLKRQSAAAPAASVTPAATGTSPAPAAPTKTIVINSGRMDPESYDYFQYYYLYPRTLANVNQTLGYNAAYYGFNLGRTYAIGVGPRYYGYRNNGQFGLAPR